jgi:hypothetical protein
MIPCSTSLAPVLCYALEVDLVLDRTLDHRLELVSLQLKGDDRKLTVKGIAQFKKPRQMHRLLTLLVFPQRRYGYTSDVSEGWLRQVKHDPPHPQEKNQVTVISD